MSLWNKCKTIASMTANSYANGTTGRPQEDMESNKKEYYTEEFRAIKQFNGANVHAYNKINNIQETKEVEERNCFEGFCRDSIVGIEQIK